MSPVYLEHFNSESAVLDKETALLQNCSLFLLFIGGTLVLNPTSITGLK